MKMRKQKKGSSHVEIILSFVLFISFIIFMLIVFKPLDMFSKSATDIEEVESKILQNISTVLSVLFPIRIHASVYSGISSEPCFYIDNPLSTSLTVPLIMKNKTGGIINASRQGDQIYFENSGDFYNLFYSSELKERELSDTNPCTTKIEYELDNEEYTIGLIRSYNVISYSKLVDFKTRYNNNYNQLKQQFGFEDDFIISIVNSPEIVFELAKPKPLGIETLARDVSIFILKDNTDLNPDIMNIQVWG
jgi:hypothetical protein